MVSKSLVITSSKKDQIIDITEKIEENLRDDGLCNIFIAHTTAALTTADLDPGTDLDFLEALRKILPNINYRHPHNPSHTPDHILSSLIGASITIPFEKGKLILGTWQKVILVELDGPRERKVYLSFSQ